MPVLACTAVVIELPKPRALGRLGLDGDRTRYVPLMDTPATDELAAERLRELALWFLEGLPAALRRDIPGASIEIRVLG